MISTLMLISILDLLLGINILSPILLIQKSLGGSEVVQVDSGSIPYLLPANETNYFPIRDWGVQDPFLTARSVTLYDASSDKVLYSVNSETRLPIASLTKFMTAVVVIENIGLNDVVEIKSSAIEKSKKEGGGNDLYEGEKIKAGDLLKIMLIESSNVAAYALVGHFGEKYGGDFVGK